MQTITQQFNVYKFAELSETAKQKAINSELENFDFSFHAECIIDDFKNICDLIGVDVDQVYYSGFCSQGDGASFTGKAAYKKGALNALKQYAPLDDGLHGIVANWVEFQKRNFYKLSCNITHSGRYYHAYTMQFEWIKDGYFYDTKSDGEEILQDLANWLYKTLEREYDFQTDEKQLIENIEADNCLFLESGKPFAGSL